ncbi:glycoside hydrolase family 2 protein [Glutamicibacter sp. X7]
MQHTEQHIASALTRRALNTGWSVRATAGPVPDEIKNRVVPATVPGVIHLDLLAAQLIEDPYLDDNEALQSWIGLSDFSYRTSFEVTEEQLETARHELDFEGLDTVATISLNGTTILSAANQHRRYLVDVTELLHVGANDLVVDFSSPVKYANEQSSILGMRPRPYPLPYDAIRKSACSFGWDWGIKTASSGIWKPVSLISWSTAKLGGLLISAAPRGTGGVISVNAQIERTEAVELELLISCAGQETVIPVPAETNSINGMLHLDEVQLWWPAGYGEQPLYEVSVSLRAGATQLDEAARTVGFRTVRWDTTVDEAGTRFQLIVNEQPVYVKGANWIPDDAFPSRVDAGRYTQRLTQAKDAGLNLIRVWGGGIYESDDFFSACDELGLLSWQDFLFACAAYSEEEPLRSEVIAEARDNVARLAHHASLVMFCGNNENLWGYEDWDWKRYLDSKSWGGAYYHEILPGIVEELAAHVPYSPGSPFSPHGQHPNAEEHGTMHIWDLWNNRDYPDYRTYRPRFAAEFGWQGPAAWSTLTRSISDEPLTPESPGMVVHQKAMEGNTKLTVGLVGHYQVPSDMEQWHWAMQLNQANAITCALDHFRSIAPHNSGAIVWQLNDCWPVTSWAAIDGDGIEKPLFHALKNSFAPRRVIFSPNADGLSVVFSNDSAEEWEGTALIERRSYSGVVAHQAEQQISVPARGNVRIELSAELSSSTAPGEELLAATLGATRGYWYFAEPRDSRLAPAHVETSVHERGHELVLNVTSGNFVRDLSLLVDKLHPAARVDRGLVTLLPGESTSFTITGLQAQFAGGLTDPRVLRSANQLVCFG